MRKEIMELWFRRLAEVPQVGYESGSGVDRSLLPGHNDTPEFHYHDYEGNRDISLLWPMGQGSTSASPAKSWEPTQRQGETIVEFKLRRLNEKLELPGTLSDYHFAIQGCHDELSRLTRQSPQVMEVIETLCWLDIRLIEHFPDTITYESGGEKAFFGVSAFHRLISLYQKEGYLDEALRIAQIAEKYRHAHNLEDLQQRITLIEAEENVF